MTVGVTLAGHDSMVRRLWFSAFAQQLGRAVPFTQCGTLDKAVAAAHALAQREKLGGGVVLLSPACASWDQYRSFEIRGDHFRDLVRQLAKGAA